MRQHDGIDYQVMFAPIINLAIIRLILSITVTKDWELRQFDVSNTFLHNVLEETVFMR